jgi:hypothetical protein
MRVPHRRNDGRCEIEGQGKDKEMHGGSRVGSQCSTQSLLPEFPDSAEILATQLSKPVIDFMRSGLSLEMDEALQ